MLPPLHHNAIMNTTTLISQTRGCFIELTHRDSDPGLWIVRRWSTDSWFRKRLSSDWFNSEQQALAFGAEMKRKHDGQ